MKNNEIEIQELQKQVSDLRNDIKNLEKLTHQLFSEINSLKKFIKEAIVKGASVIVCSKRVNYKKKINSPKSYFFMEAKKCESIDNFNREY